MPLYFLLFFSLSLPPLKIQKALCTLSFIATLYVISLKIFPFIYSNDIHELFHVMTHMIK